MPTNSKEYVKRYRQENKDKIAEYNKRYREKNREKYNQHINEWKKKNRAEKRKLWFNLRVCLACKSVFWPQRVRSKYCSFKCYQKRHNRLYPIPSRFYTLKTRFLILHRDNYTCQYCGRKAPDVVLQIDHIYPKSKGGRLTKDNFITACFDCNMGKRDVILTNLPANQSTLAIIDD